MLIIGRDGTANNLRERAVPIIAIEPIILIGPKVVQSCHVEIRPAISVVVTPNGPVIILVVGSDTYVIGDSRKRAIAVIVQEPIRATVPGNVEIEKAVVVVI